MRASSALRPRPPRSRAARPLPRHAQAPHYPVEPGPHMAQEGMQPVPQQEETVQAEVAEA